MKMLNPPEGNAVVIPAFIAKLWHMVSDPETDSLISWGYDGTSFIIRDHNKFSSEMLPRYYKHNNMASFIRQLNMYSFHKVLSIDSPSLKNKELEFSHPYFRKDQPNLLKKIQRKIHSREGGDIMKTDPSRYNKLLLEVKQLRAIQDLFGSKLSTMQQENAALWREYSILRQRHARQEKIVNKVIQFLISMVQQSNAFGQRKVTLPLMIKDKPAAAVPPVPKRKYVLETVDGPIICELDPNDILLESTSTEPHTFKIIRSSNKPTVVTIPAEVGQVSQPQRNKVSVTQATPVQISVPESAGSTIQLLDVLQGASSLSENPGPSNGNGGPLTSKILQKEQTASGSEINIGESKEEENRKAGNQQLIKSKVKRKISRKPGTSGFKKKKTSEDNTYSYLLNELMETNDSRTEDFEDSDTVLEPVITSPTTSFEERTPVHQPHMSPINETMLDSTTNLSDNFLDEKSLSYMKNLVNESDENTDIKTEDPNSANLSLIPANIVDSLHKDDPDKHLDKIQSEIDILKDILQNDGLCLDSNTIFELFKEDPMALNMPPPSSLSPYPSSSEIKNELISYTPSFDVDLSEISEQDPLVESENLLQSTLNTPKIEQLGEFNFQN